MPSTWKLNRPLYSWPGFAFALRRQKQFPEAEAVLLESQEQLQRSQSADRKFKREALESLVQLYEAWDRDAPNTGKSAQAAEWRKKLEAFRVEAEQVLAEPKPK